MSRPALSPRLVKLPRSPNWQIFVPAANGRPGFYKTTRTPDEAEARKFLDESQIVALAYAERADALTKTFWTRLIVGRSVSVAKARDEFEAHLAILGRTAPTIATMIGTVDRWVRFSGLGLSPIGMVVDTHIAPFVNRPEEGNRLKTHEDDLMRLRLFFNFCKGNNWIPVNPCRNVAVRLDGFTQEQLIPRKRQTFTDDEIAALLAIIPRDSFWYGATLIGKYFAPRISAVATLEWSSLPGLNRLRLFTKKARVLVDEPLPSELSAWLSAWPVADSTYVFPSQSAHQIDNSFNRLSEQFGELCRKAGVVGKTYHCFRHTKVTREFDAMLEKLGGSDRAVLSALVAQHGMKGIQQLIGHVAGSATTGSTYYNPARP